MSLEVSQSEIQMFQRCKRKWMITYYLRKGKPESVTGPLALGKRVHVALEGYYGHSVDPTKTIRELYKEDIAKFDDDTDQFGAIRTDLGKEFDLAVRMIDGYMQWLEETGADVGLTYTDVETKIVVPSGVEGVNLKGRIDARVIREWDGARLFIDNKTAASLDVSGDELQIDTQFKFYRVLEELSARYEHETLGQPLRRVDGGIRNMLKKVKRTTAAKPPFYKRIEVKHNRAEIDATVRRLVMVIRDIVKLRRVLDRNGLSDTYQQSYAYPTPDLDCSWKCQYLPVCGMMDDGSRWRDMIENQYGDIDPYAHYEENSRWSKK